MPWLLSRRQLIRALGGAAALVSIGLPGCGDNLHPSSGPFTDPQRRALAAFADVIIPPDDEPGGAALGAVAYIEGLLAAFDAMPPAIFANGPFSGRTPFANGTVPPNDFASFVELDRVAEAAWRLRVFGSAGLPNGAPNEAKLGAVPSLADQIKVGLDAAIALRGTGIDKLAPDELANLFDAQDDAWKALMIDLVAEAAFCAPEYGGNVDLAGWKLCHFEGDSQPLGYSQFNGTSYVERPDAPLTTANPGADPEPIDKDVEDLMKIVVAFLGGRVAP